MVNPNVYLTLNLFLLAGIYEYNSSGNIPYVPGFIKAPFYVWLGCKEDEGSKPRVNAEHTSAPPMFPPTFLYHQSWEDPAPDSQVR